MDLIIVRHGRPERVEGLETAADPGLTDIGHAQAKMVGEFLLAEGVDHVVTSPMQRARETAGPLADALGMSPQVVADLAEIDQGASQYVPLEEMKAEGGEAWLAVVNDPTAMHNDVDIDSFADKVTAAFEQVIADNPSRKVAAFCHGMVTMQYLRRLLGYEDPHALRIDYAGLTRVQASSSGSLRSVRSVNETGHLGDTLILSP